MKRAKTIALIAGFGFFFLALALQGILPYLMEENRVTSVAKTVRTPLGELAEVKAEAAAVYRPPPEGEAGVHPRGVLVLPFPVPAADGGGKPALGAAYRSSANTPTTCPISSGRGGSAQTSPGSAGNTGTTGTPRISSTPGWSSPIRSCREWTWFFAKAPADGKRVLSEEGKALTAFVQNLGMNKGKWRDAFPYQIAERGSSSIESAAAIEHGRAVYERRCSGCHGEKGDGKGTAPGTVLFAIALPRDFTAGVYKFRTTPTGSVPLDSDIYRTITVGIRGTAMPPWFNLPEEDRWDVVHFIKTFSADFKQYPPDAPIAIGRPPKPTAELIAQGKKVFAEMQCEECHGPEGKGDGPSSEDAGRRFRQQDTAGEFHPGGVQERAAARGHLSDIHDGAERHPDAVVRRFVFFGR